MARPGMPPPTGLNGMPLPPGMLRPRMPMPPPGPYPGGPGRMLPPGMVPPPIRPHHHHPVRRRPESEYMDADEIETILRIQWKSLHNGPTYVEDYYFQACSRPTFTVLCRPDASAQYREHCAAHRAGAFSGSYHV